MHAQPEQAAMVIKVLDTSRALGAVVAIAGSPNCAAHAPHTLAVIVFLVAEPIERICPRQRKLVPSRQFALQSFCDNWRKWEASVCRLCHLADSHPLQYEEAAKSRGGFHIDQYVAHLRSDCVHKDRYRPIEQPAYCDNDANNKHAEDTFHDELAVSALLQRRQQVDVLTKASIFNGVGAIIHGWS